MSVGVRAGAVLLVVFAAGVLAGVVLQRHHSVPPVAAMSAAEEHEAAMAEMTEALALDQDQVAQIHAIMVQHQNVVQLKWEELRPEVQAAMGQVHAAIADILHDDQISRFHRWLSHRREQHVSNPAPHGEHDER